MLEEQREREGRVIVGAGGDFDEALKLDSISPRGVLVIETKS